MQSQAEAWRRRWHGPAAAAAAAVLLLLLLGRPWLRVVRQAKALQQACAVLHTHCDAVVLLQAGTKLEERRGF